MLAIKRLDEHFQKTSLERQRHFKDGKVASEKHLFTSGDGEREALVP